MDSNAVTFLAEVLCLTVSKSSVKQLNGGNQYTYNYSTGTMVLKSSPALMELSLTDFVFPHYSELMDNML